MPAATSHQFIECVGPEQRLHLVVGAGRIPLGGLRPQAEALIRYMVRQSTAHKKQSHIFAHEELKRAIWGTRRVANERVQLARLVFEIRQVLTPLVGPDAVIRSVPGQGYALTNQGFQSEHQRSPFVCGPPITHPAGFFGRDFQLRRIENIWNRFPLQHVVLSGPGRSGKTSLLRFLERINTPDTSELRRRQASRLPASPAARRVVFIDCQDARLATAEAMMHHIPAQLDLAVSGSPSLATFADTLARISCPTILLFDEADVALRNPDFDPGFWTALSSLAANFTRGFLGYVIAVNTSLSEAVCNDALQSPFLNIFGHSLKLGPLLHGEAVELIRSSPRPFSEADEQWILTESGCHPCLLQILSDTRLTALEEEQPEASWKQEGLARIQRFGHLLSGS